MSYRNLSHFQERKIINIFLANRSLTETAKLMKCSKDFVKKVLKVNNLDHLVLRRGTKKDWISYYAQIRENPNPDSKIEIRKIINK